MDHLSVCLVVWLLWQWLLDGRLVVERIDFLGIPVKRDGIFRLDGVYIIEYENIRAEAAA